MAAKLHFSLVSPAKELFSGEVDHVIAHQPHELLQKILQGLVVFVFIHGCLGILLQLLHRLHKPWVLKP